MNENGCGNKIGPYSCCSIITGDAKELAKAIPDESIDLIFTDPVYDRIEDYRWLAEVAAGLLKRHAHLLTCFGIGHIGDTLAALAGSLQYRWILGAFEPNGPSRRAAPTMFSKWWAVAWYDKTGSSRTPAHFPDMVEALGYQNWFGSHQWRKNPTPFGSWLRGFTGLGDSVLDPFCGGGTVPAVCKMLGRHYLAFEIDPGVAERARERVRNTQPPLFVMQPEQAEMDIG